jgi:hypothetical protein
MFLVSEREKYKQKIDTLGGAMKQKAFEVLR